MELQWEQIGLRIWTKENEKFIIELNSIGDMEYCYSYYNYESKLTFGDKFLCIGNIYEVMLETDFRVHNKIEEIIFYLKMDSENVKRGYKF